MRTCLLGCLAVLFVAGEAAAQTIQLPSFSSFGVNTTVVVPDSGGAFITRDRRSYQNLNSFRGFTPIRGRGISRQTTGIGITAQIHDPAAADAALLSRSSAAGTPVAKDAASLRIGAGRAATDAPLGSVAELKQRRARQAARQAAETQREAKAFFDKGRQAQAAGKSSLAAVYFGMAARRATGPLRDKIVLHIDALNDNSPATARTSRREP